MPKIPKRRTPILTNEEMGFLKGELLCSLEIAMDVLEYADTPAAKSDARRRCQELIRLIAKF